MAVVDSQIAAQYCLAMAVFKSQIWGLPVADWAWILALTILRFLISGRHGLGVDEAHYAIYGLRLDWSYFDHPPLLGWVEAPFVRGLGRFESAVRLPAILCGLASSVLAFRLSLRMTGELVAARWATLALTSSFLVTGLWLMFLPDTLLLLLTLLLINVALNVLIRDQWSDWLQSGLILGLCGLTKYTAVIFAPALIGCLVIEGRARKLKSLKFFVAAILAAILVLPVFYWNSQHDWVSFKYQTGHVLGGAQYRLRNLGQFIVTQFVAYNPLILLAGAIGWYQVRSDRANQGAVSARTIRLVLWFSVPTFLFFAYAAIKEPGLPHWTLTAWALLIIAGVSQAPKKSKLVRALIVASTMISLFLLIELAHPFLPFAPFQSPYADLVGWRELHNKISEIKASDSQGRFVIGVTNWTLGSRAHFYLDDLAPVYVIDDRFDQFDLWEGPLPTKAKVLLLEWRGFETERAKAHCTSQNLIGDLVFKQSGRDANSVRLTWCEFAR